MEGGRRQSVTCIQTRQHGLVDTTEQLYLLPYQEMYWNKIDLCIVARNMFYSCLNRPQQYLTLEFLEFQLYVHNGGQFGA
jgi:hypothetical protein